MENKSARSESQSAGSNQFAGSGQFKENSRGGVNASGGLSVSDSIARGKEAVGSAADEAMNSAGSDLQSLRTDLNGLKDTLTKFMSQAAGDVISLFLLTESAYISASVGVCRHNACRSH